MTGSAFYFSWLFLSRWRRPKATLTQTSPTALKNLSLEELSQIEVTTPSKAPVAAFRTPDAIYVITGEATGMLVAPDRRFVRRRGRQERGRN